MLTRREVRDRREQDHVCSGSQRRRQDTVPFDIKCPFWDQTDLSSVDEMSIPEHELPCQVAAMQGDLLVFRGRRDSGRENYGDLRNGEVETMSFQNHLHRLRTCSQGCRTTLLCVLSSICFHADSASSRARATRPRSRICRGTNCQRSTCRIHRLTSSRLSPRRSRQIRKACQDA